MSTVEESVDVAVPVSVAYNQWTQFESFPSFMGGVESITQVDDTHNHWVTRVAGVTREFDTEITEQHPDERIAWHSVDGDTRHAGEVTFHRLAEAETRVGEAVSGISEEMGDIGMAMQRAQDKTEQMQARAGALDELLASGALEDATVPGGRDDVQSQLDALTAGHDVDDELAQMKAQLPASAAPPAVEGPGTASADPSASPPGQQATS